MRLKYRSIRVVFECAIQLTIFVVCTIDFVVVNSYMFRNAEYVVALKKLMKLRNTASLQDYKEAFNRLDTNNSGFIEANEIATLLNDVYDGRTPAYEVSSFIQFFDQNNDGKVSWDEFEVGLGAALASQSGRKSTFNNVLPRGVEEDEGDNGDDDDDDDEVLDFGEPEVSGRVKIELKDGEQVEVDAKEYIQSLKEEARALKEAIARRNGRGSSKPPQVANGMSPGFLASAMQDGDEYGSITQYLASRQGNVKSLTEGISPEIVETMKMLVDFVLEGGESGNGKGMPKKEEMEMEIPGSALQQLALWQLVLGYKLREAEAKGDYLKILE